MLRIQKNIHLRTNLVYEIRLFGWKGQFRRSTIQAKNIKIIIKIIIIIKMHIKTSSRVCSYLRLLVLPFIPVRFGPVGYYTFGFYTFPVIYISFGFISLLVYGNVLAQIHIVVVRIIMKPRAYNLCIIFTSMRFIQTRDVMHSQVIYDCGHC